MITGEDVRINSHAHFAHPDLAEIGNHCAIDWGFYCTTQFKIKDYIHIAPYCTVIGGRDGCFSMGNFSGMAAGCRIVCSSDDFSGDYLIGPTIPAECRKVTVSSVVLEDFVTLATNVVVFPGVTIAMGTVIGANSVVTKSTKPWGIYLGNPARFFKARSKGLLEHARKLGYEYDL